MKKTIYIMLAEEKTKLDIAKLFSKVYAAVTQICIATIITVLAAKYLIAIAYEQRGYEAIGGEYLAILMIFLATYKLVGFAMRLISAKVEKTWTREK